MRNMRRQDLALISFTFISLLFGVTLFVTFSGAVSSQQAAVSPSKVEDYRYDDWHTFKHGKPYTTDPYVWIYTKEFARTFRMPEQWSDDNLKGALAIAFRMTTIGETTCGLGGRQDNCWSPLRCQLDVYYDSRVRLPWMRDDIGQDFLLRGVSSQDYLFDPSHSKGFNRYRPKDGKGIPRVLASDVSIHVGKYHFGSAQVAYFNREYYTGVGLIGWVGVGVCPDPIGTGRISFYDLETEDKIGHMQIKREDAKPMHIIELPESFMRRANAIYIRDNKPNVAATEGLRQQFLESGRPSTKPQ